MSRVLSAPLKVSFDYTRSTGPVIGRFMTGLRDRHVLGARISDGRVVVPPVEYDPVTHEAVTEFAAVADTGTVVSWSWVSEPVAEQPFDRPFAFALVRLDGADTPMLHAVDVDSPDAMSTGMRVRVRWAEETAGHITDIACFEPAPDAPDAPPPHPLRSSRRSTRSPASSPRSTSTTSTRRPPRSRCSSAVSPRGG